MKNEHLQEKACILDAPAMGRALTRIAHEILEKNKGTEGLVLIGICRRGVPLAERIAARIREIEGVEVPVGALDITFYRDDLSHIAPAPVLRRAEVGVPITDCHVVLVDDVIYTGRTVRAAIEGLFDLGRPANVRLAVLIDRGQRELPIRPDFVGKNIPTAKDEVVRVRVTEIDGEDSVAILAPAET